MDTSRIYQRNIYGHPIAYMLEKYIQYHIYVREAHTDTATYILHNIYWRNTHRYYNLYWSYINIYSNARLE